MKANGQEALEFMTLLIWLAVFFETLRQQYPSPESTEHAYTPSSIVRPHTTNTTLIHTRLTRLTHAAIILPGCFCQF